MNVTAAFLSLGALVFAASAFAEVRPACVPAKLLLPAPTSDNPAHLTRFLRRDSAIYLAEVFSASADLRGVTDEQRELDLGCAQNLAPEVLALLKTIAMDPGAIDAWAARPHLGAVYQKSRLHRFRDFPVPATLSDFAQRTDFKAWDRRLVMESRVKGKTRVLYHSPTGYRPRISVAQTLETVEADFDAPVRETEIIFERDPDSGQWDFVVYDRDGQLATESEFRGGSQQPAPGICMTCHYEPSTRLFSTFLRPGGQ